MSGPFLRFTVTDDAARYAAFKKQVASSPTSRRSTNEETQPKQEDDEDNVLLLEDAIPPKSNRRLQGSVGKVVGANPNAKRNTLHAQAITKVVKTVVTVAKAVVHTVSDVVTAVGDAINVLTGGTNPDPNPNPTGYLTLILTLTQAKSHGIKILCESLATCFLKYCLSFYLAAWLLSLPVTLAGLPPCHTTTTQAQERLQSQFLFPRGLTMTSPLTLRARIATFMLDSMQSSLAGLMIIIWTTWCHHPLTIHSALT